MSVPNIFQRCAGAAVDSVQAIRARRTAVALAGLFLTAGLASIALPGLSGFVPEYLVLVGTFAVNPIAAGFAVGCNANVNWPDINELRSSTFRARRISPPKLSLNSLMCWSAGSVVFAA